MVLIHLCFSFIFNSQLSTQVSQEMKSIVIASAKRTKFKKNSQAQSNPDGKS